MIIDPGRASRLPLLAKILIGYGIAGLIAAVIAALVLVLAFGRVSALSSQLKDNAGGVSAVLDKTATALDDASASAASFATTMDTTSAAVLQATADMRQIVPRLRDLETAANGVTILGAQPLGRLGTLFGEIADYLTDISGQVDGIATSLVGNRSALERNASSLAAVATEVRTLSATLAGDQLAAAIDSVRWLILALLVIAAIGAAVPAAGALATGWWLRGWLRAPRPGGVAT